MAEAAPRVLLAVADFAAAALYQTLLEIHGFDVVLAMNGCDAVELALRDRPTLAVIGAGLPQPRVVELCRVMKARRATDTIPLLIIAPSVDREGCRDLVEAGADQILAEPCAPALLALEARRLSARTTTSPTSRRDPQTRRAADSKDLSPPA